MNIFYSIRTALTLTQKELAEQLHVSFATVNRWENDKAIPSQKVQERLYDLCCEKKVNIAEAFLADVEKEVATLERNHPEKTILYHGSKSEINGEIRPISRDRCDFGAGFYMGTDPRQPLTLICDYPESTFYILSIDLEKLNVLTIPADIEWAMFVAYNRGRMDAIKGTSLYEKYASMGNNKDIVVGSIANDRMFFVIDNFFRGNITDVALTHSLSALNLGQQYVAVTEEGCQAVIIEKEIVLPWVVRHSFEELSKENRSKGIEFADRICKEYRREGRFFDEILDAAKR